MRNLSHNPEHTGSSVGSPGFRVHGGLGWSEKDRLIFLAGVAVAVIVGVVIVLV